MSSFSGTLANGVESGLIVVEKNSEGANLNEIKYSYDDINSTMTSVGAPGGTYQSFQGPTFDPANLWDPKTTVNVENLNNKVIGVPVKELLEKVKSSDKIVNVTFVADDGFKKTLPGENIINPPKEQGVPILAYWYADSGLLPEENGYRLYFTTPDGLYSNSDMKNTLPEAYLHYFYNSADKILYPSAKGMSIAKVVEIDIEITK
jgi:hypothetical protein